MIEIKGFENYCVTMEGKIYSKLSNKFLKPYIDKVGYAYVSILLKPKTYRRKSVHRLVLEAYTNSVCSRTQINHIDGNKSNNDITNLEWCTRSENMAHAYETGLLSKVGIKNSLAKLSERDVASIRSSSLSNTQLGKLYNIDRSTISNIRTRKTWKHVG